MQNLSKILLIIDRENVQRGIWIHIYKKAEFLLFDINVCNKIGNKNDVLFISSVKKDNKKEPTGEINPNTGKKIYKAVPDKYEYWLQKYVVK